MLETRFKVALLLVVAAFASLPIIAIYRGTILTPFENTAEPSGAVGHAPAASGEPNPAEAPLPDEMVEIPAGPFLRGYDRGGFDEAPQAEVMLDAYSIDKYEVSNHHYKQFVAATGHRKSGPPPRYAKNGMRMQGVNQPAVYVSYDDAQEYCRWKGKRLPTEAEWEKAMRGPDGRLWPWGTDDRASGANWGRVDDGYDITAPSGTFKDDRSPYGVMDGAGNVLEWVGDWYFETEYKDGERTNPRGPEFGTYRVMRGGSYITSGADVRITSRSKIVPDFRDETIGFRCAKSAEPKK